MPRTQECQLLLVLAVVACLIGGTGLLARPPAPPARPPLDGSQISHHPDGSLSGVFAIRVGEIFEAPGMAPLAEQANRFLATRLTEIGIPSNLPIRVQDIEQVTGTHFLRIHEDGAESTESASGAPYAVRMKKPFDWVALLRGQFPGAKVIREGGSAIVECQVVIPTARLATPACFLVPDDRSLIVGVRQSAVGWPGEHAKRPTASWAREWKEVEGDLAAMTLVDPKGQYAGRLAKLPPRDDLDPESRKWDELRREVCRLASQVVLGVNAHEGLTLRARFTCASAEDAIALEKVLGSPLKKNKGNRATEPQITRLVHALLSTANLRREGKQVVLTATGSGFGLEALPGLLGNNGKPATTPNTELRPRRRHVFPSSGKLLAPPTFSVDGNMVVTCAASSPNTGPEVRVWDANTGKSIAGPLTGKGVGSVVALRSDGRLLMTGDSDGMARMWELPSGKPLGPAWKCFSPEECVPDQHLASQMRPPAISRLSFSPTGMSIAALTVAYESDPKKLPRCKVRTWEFSPEKVTAIEPREWPDEATPIRFALDGKLTSPTGSPLHPVKQARQIFEDARKEKKVLFCNALSEDGTRLLTGDFEGQLPLWDLATRKPVGQPLKYGKAEQARVGDLLRRANSDVPAEQWKQILDHLPPLVVTAVALSADAKRAAAVTTFLGAKTSGHVWLWDLQERRVIAGPLDVSLPDKAPGSTGVIQFSPFGSLLAIGVNRRESGQNLVGEVQLWDLRPDADPPVSGNSPPRSKP